ncbi:MAG: ATP-binding protein [Bacilli bacterium]|nr:ATP-binding protein [Bacilli bacterium]MDY4156138.1 ATP-binding protein [Bacilli bacterium]
MDNGPRVQAFCSFAQQAKECYESGDKLKARELFLKAATVANEIATSSTSFNVQMEYHKYTESMLRQANLCVQVSKKVESNNSGRNNEDDVVSFHPESKENQITFDDVAGLTEVKDQIIYNVLEPLKNPELAEIYGIKAGGKILLYGPPGTGKTFIARAIAGEVDAAFYSVNCQDLISKYMGESSKTLDKLFDDAQKNERAIIFFDEFDSVASKRSDSTGGADAEMSRFVATFLTKVDGFKKSKTCKMLLLIAATNRPWAIDSAMVRGGRFDTQIYVGLPDLEARLFIIEKAFKKVPTDTDVDFAEIARRLDGYGCGDIKSICEKIKLETYMKSVKTGIKKNVSNMDCEKVISNSRNNLSEADLQKFEMYKEGLLE